MPRYAFATLNHSSLHGRATDWEAHLNAAADAEFDALAPDVFWLRALEEEGVSLSTLSGELKQRGLACMEIAGIAIAAPDATKAELEENRRYAELLGAEFVNARIVAPLDDEVIQSVAHCAEVFSEVGTQVALEFSRGTTLRGVSETLKLIQAAGVANLGVTLDTWHFFLAESGPDWNALGALSIAALANVQLSDGVAYSEGEFGKATMNERRLPGDGDFDLRECARVLGEKGFDEKGQGAIVVEVLNAEWRARPLSEFAEASIAASRRTWVA